MIRQIDLRSTLLRKANFYVINLALSDCLMAGATYWMFFWSSIQGIWQFGKFGIDKNFVILRMP